MMTMIIRIEIKIRQKYTIISEATAEFSSHSI